MTNTNCPEGIRCPKCGQENRFFITGNAQFVVTDDGSEAVGDHEWNDDSPTGCPACGHDGRLREFQSQPDLPPDPEGLSDAGLQDLIRDAGAAFWAVVAKRIPQATNGDLSPWTAVRLRQAQEGAVREWIENNVPVVSP